MAGKKKFWERIREITGSAELNNAAPNKQTEVLNEELANAICVLTAELCKHQGVSEKCEELILDFFVRQFGKGNYTKQLLKLREHTSLGPTPYLKITCTQLRLTTDSSTRGIILRFLFEVASADDFLQPKTLRSLHRIAGYAGIEESVFQKTKLEHLTVNSPYAILETEPSDDFERVKSAYKRMLVKCHPDKRPPNTSEREASEKFMLVQRAFEVICQQNGWK
jgi:DnaJ like chaperone protein